jgi:hypothetical protein
VQAQSVEAKVDIGFSFLTSAVNSHSEPQPGILANRFMVSFVPLSGVPGALRYFGERQYRIRIAISVSLEHAA